MGERLWNGSEENEGFYEGEGLFWGYFYEGGLGILPQKNSKLLNVKMIHSESY